MHLEYQYSGAILLLAVGIAPTPLDGSRSWSEGKMLPMIGIVQPRYSMEIGGIVATMTLGSPAGIIKAFIFTPL